MAFVNYSCKEINVKIVYYGPGLSGKTANLQYLYKRAPTHAKGRLISLATETERTLFFDFLPMNLGTLKGFQVRFHLYTVPGQVFYEASRKLILKGVDGLVFVADSSPFRVDANAESYLGLQRNLAEYDLAIQRVPAVIQYNKRDLEDALPVEEIRAALGHPQLQEFEGVAIEGTGVFETLKALAREVLKNLKDSPLGKAAEDQAATVPPLVRQPREAPETIAAVRPGVVSQAQPETPPVAAVAGGQPQGEFVPRFSSVSTRPAALTPRAAAFPPLHPVPPRGEEPEEGATQADSGAVPGGAAPAAAPSAAHDSKPARVPFWRRPFSFWR